MIPGNYFWKVKAKDDSEASRWSSQTWSLTVLPPQGDSIPFAPAVSYHSGQRPQAVFCADLDGDGDQDVTVANSLYDCNVSVFKNTGYGTFPSKTDYGTGMSYPVSVLCADVDGDNDLDMITANSRGVALSLFRNGGDGTFQVPSFVGYMELWWPVTVFCANLDGDGDVDLVVANNSNNNVSILRNDGDGSFQPAVHYDMGNIPQGVFCADLDGDNDQDIAVTIPNSGLVSILKTTAMAHFNPKLTMLQDKPRARFIAQIRWR